MLMTAKEYDFIIDQIDRVGRGSLTEWECKFFDSIKAQREMGRTLTNKQIECLSKIWEK